MSSGQPVASLPRQELQWAVVSTPFALFVAHLIANRLRVHGWLVDVHENMPVRLDYDWYLVLCPQMFSELPPANRRIVFQLEQSISSRWFTPSYLDILRKSAAVLDYARVNVGFLEAQGISSPQVSFVHIGALAGYAESVGGARSWWQDHWTNICASLVRGQRESSEQFRKDESLGLQPRGSGLVGWVLDRWRRLFGHCVDEKTCDVLFYGDFKDCPRRLALLDALGSHFNLRVVGGVFGAELIALIKGARLVINLHYYENALLEMPRIAECLSLGVPVVSESAQDQDDYPELAGAVVFFQQGSIPAMLAAVRGALQDPVCSGVLAECQARSGARFAGEFDRFLSSAGFLPATRRLEESDQGGGERP